MQLSCVVIDIKPNCLLLSYTDWLRTHEAKNFQNARITPLLITLVQPKTPLSYNLPDQFGETVSSTHGL